jgi:hypothetical protein
MSITLMGVCMIVGEVFDWHQTGHFGLSPYQEVII